MALIGRANGVVPRPARARPARGRRTNATDAAHCTAADLQDRRQRMAWRSLQRLVPPTASSPRRSVQRPSAGPRWGARCEQSWLSWRNGSWSTVIWTRNGAKIGSFKAVIVDHWHWTNCRGGYCGLSWGQAGMPLKGPTNHGLRFWDNGPMILAW